MKVMVIGSGGREHALAWKLSKSSRITSILCAPGNTGMETLGTCMPVSADDTNGLLKLATAQRVDFVVVGPEQPLAEGIVDRFEVEKIPVFGPSRGAAQLESSKVFAKEFFARYHIPTAAFDVCESADDALHCAMKRDGQCAIKADGLAAGKGVIVCRDMDSARIAVRRIVSDREFGTAGNRVIIEDILQGEEASIMAVCDGDSYMLMESSQDHKALYESDNGPNTGGMGAYSPAPVVSSVLQQKVSERIIEPTLKGMQNMGFPFKGVLYAGIMVIDGEPYALEFNVRFGDPETQPVLMRLESDLTTIIEASINGSIGSLEKPVWHPGASVCVVVVSDGYPGSYKKGHVITGLDSLPPGDDYHVFHAGVRKEQGKLVSAGGRVLGVTARGSSILQARDAAYEIVSKLHFEGCRHRKDIGWRALERLSGHDG
jgi:phosphoribosylamine---glycine ligase